MRARATMAARLLGALALCWVVVESVFFALNGFRFPSYWERRLRVVAPALEQRADPLAQARAARFRVRQSLGEEPAHEVQWEQPAPGEQLDWSHKYDSRVGDGEGHLFPNVSSRSVSRTTRGRLLYDVRLHTDAFARRATSNPDPGKRRKPLLVFGCSFAFGDGVQDEETFPSRLALEAPEYRVYNYGIAGNGPFHALRDLQERDFSREVPERNGIGVYLYIRDHLRRIMPSLYYVNYRGPYYEADSGGKLRRFANYAEAHPVFAGFYRLLSLSPTLA
jgi:hypothetical protein